jgi:hypothetical protein
MFKKLLILIAGLLLIIMAGLVIYPTKKSEDSQVIKSSLVELTVNNLDSQVVVESSKPLLVKWRVAEDLTNPKCFLTGYDSWGNSGRWVGVVGEFAVTGLPQGFYYYTLSCLSGGKEYIDLVDVKVK